MEAANLGLDDDETKAASFSDDSELLKFDYIYLELLT